MKNIRMCSLVFIAMMLIMLSGVSNALIQQTINAPQLNVVLLKYDPIPAQAGEYVRVYIKLENKGRIDLGNVECALEPKFPFSLDSGEDPKRSIGKLTPLSTALIDYKVRVDSDAVNGDNDLDIRCSPNGLENGYFVSKLRINVRSENPEFAIGAISSEPEDIKAGEDDVKLNVEIQNIGEGSAKLVSTELMLPKGFSPSSSYSNMYNIGYVQADSSRTASFHIDVEDDTKPDVYYAVLKIRYKNENNNEDEYKEQKLTVPLTVKPSPQFEIEEVRAGSGNTASDTFTGYVVRGNAVISPSEISQGSKGEIRIKIRNTGQEEAKSVSVKIFKDSTHPFDFDEIYDFIGNLKPNQTGEALFKFTVDNDAPLKTYLIDIEIRYVEDNDVKTVDKTIPLAIMRRDGRTSFTYMFVGALVLIGIIGFAAWKKRGNNKK